MPTSPSFLMFFLLLLASQTWAQTVVITVGPSIPTDAPQFVQAPLFTSAILNSTNFYRAEHNASAVSWNGTLSDFAAAYLNSTCDFAHSGGPYGENIALGCSNATSCVEAWGDEGAHYDYAGEFTEDTGHFTQLVWKNTTDVGCGARLCGDSGWYLVCEYWPRGNVIGAFSDQVSPGVGSLAVATRPSGAGVLLVVLVLLVLM